MRSAWNGSCWSPRVRTEHGACIVVVEDDPDILDLVRTALDIEGYDVVGFNRPFDPAALPHDPRLFLVDIMLPGSTGIELARMLREERQMTVPMVAMSASVIMIERAHASGYFQAVLRKPFNLDELLDTLERQLAA
jgi:DNA-binding response OmpR family regulator